MTGTQSEPVLDMLCNLVIDIWLDDRRIRIPIAPKRPHLALRGRPQRCESHAWEFGQLIGNVDPEE
jgi:hypothetical protein